MTLEECRRVGSAACAEPKVVDLVVHHVEKLLGSEEEREGNGEGVVYKLVGPLLVRQDTYEAKANVGKPKNRRIHARYRKQNLMM